MMRCAWHPSVMTAADWGRAPSRPRGLQTRRAQDGAVLPAVVAVRVVRLRMCDSRASKKESVGRFSCRSSAARGRAKQGPSSPPPATRASADPRHPLSAAAAGPPLLFAASWWRHRVGPQIFHSRIRQGLLDHMAAPKTRVQLLDGHKEGEAPRAAPARASRPRRRRRLVPHPKRAVFWSVQPPLLAQAPVAV